jgi:hypothetical protein
MPFRLAVTAPARLRTWSGPTVSPAGTAVTQELWESVVTAGRDPAVQGPDFTQALTELSNMTQHRRVRHLESEFRLPGLLWTVLLAGGIITIISSCLLSAENLGLHFVLVVGMSLMLGITLLAISEVDQPFPGAGRRNPAAHMGRAGAPQRLREIYDPPPLLYVRGNIELLNRHQISVVGSRRPPPYRNQMAERPARDWPIAGR